MDIRGRKRRYGVTLRFVAVAVVLALGAAACGGGTDQGSGPAAPGPQTQTEAAERPDAPGSVDDQCQALIVDLLQAIEPYVAGHDAASMHSDDFDADGLAAATAVFEEDIQSSCQSMNTPEGYEMMADLARDNAPGTVWYVELMGTLEEMRSSG